MHSIKVYVIIYCALLTGIVLVSGRLARAAYISANISASNISGKSSLHTDSQKLHISTSSDIYGWTVTAKASSKDLINTSDATYKINGVNSTKPVSLSANQWGYNIGTSSSTVFMKMPGGHDASPVTLFSVDKDSHGDCTNVSSCDEVVAFGANIDKRQAGGVYSTVITYTVTSKPKPYVPSYTPSTPSSGDSSSSGSGDYGSGSSSGSSDYGSGSSSDSGGSSVDPSAAAITNKCMEMFPGSDSLSNNKFAYCTSHNADMSGWYDSVSPYLPSPSPSPSYPSIRPHISPDLPVPPSPYYPPYYPPYYHGGYGIGPNGSSDYASRSGSEHDH